jgi:8-oxo-dGTP pyrophosphatase MutT (NUDIX family)
MSTQKIGKSERPKDIKHVSSVGVFDPNGRMLWGRRRDTGKYVNPAGHLEPNETPEQAAVRELREEAGLELPVRWLGDGRCGDYIIHCFVADAPADSKPTSQNDPDQEVETWEWTSIENGLPAEVSQNLHAPRNVLLRLLGMQEWPVEWYLPVASLDKAEVTDPRDIVVCIPRSRMADVEREEAQVAATVAAGHKPPTYYWTVHRLPRVIPRRVYFCWDGAVRAYHDVVSAVTEPDPRLILDHRIHNIQPVEMGSFRGWRYWNDSIEKSENADDVELLLSSSDPAERALALKLEGVRRHHLEAALRSEDPALVAGAAKHPGVDAQMVADLMAETGHEEAKKLVSARNELSKSEPSVPGNTDPFRAAVASLVSELSVTIPQILERPAGTAAGIIYRLDPTPADKDVLPVRAAYEAAGMGRFYVRAVATPDSSGRAILVRELDTGWIPVAELATAQGGEWKVELDARVLRTEAARIVALDWLLGCEPHNGWNVVLDGPGRRLVSLSTLSTSFASKVDPGVLCQPEELSAAFAWLSTVTPQVETACLRHLPMLGRARFAAICGRAAALQAGRLPL